MTIMIIPNYYFYNCMILIYSVTMYYQVTIFMLIPVIVLSLAVCYPVFVV